jgi:hypothetical protein
MMRHCPASSVVAVRTFSMSASLETSTTTPGNTAPDASRTVPVSVAWALGLAPPDAAENPTAASSSLIARDASCSFFQYGTWRAL